MREGSVQCATTHKELPILTLAVLEQLAVALAPRLQLGVGVLPSVISILALLSLGALELGRVEPDASSSLVSESSVDDALDEGDDLGQILGDASESRRPLDVKSSHRLEVGVLPVGGEVAEDGWVVDGAAELRDGPERSAFVPCKEIPAHTFLSSHRLIASWLAVIKALASSTPVLPSFAAFSASTRPTRPARTAERYMPNFSSLAFCTSTHLVSFSLMRISSHASLAAS